MQNVHDVAESQATRFKMRNTGRKGGVKAVDINGYVDPLDALTKLLERGEGQWEGGEGGDR